MRRLGSAFLDTLINPGKWHRNRAGREGGYGWQEKLLPGSKVSRQLREVGRRPLLVPVLSLLLFATFGFLGTRLLELQIVRGQENRLSADQNRVRGLIIRPPRGRIYDRNGVILASSSPGFRLVAETDHELDEEVCSELAKLIEMPADEVALRVEKGREQGLPLVVVKENLTQETALLIEANRERFPFFRNEISPLREYSSPEVYAHLLGFVGEVDQDELNALSGSGYYAGSRIGKSGVEKSLESFLRGFPGELVLELDATGGRSRDLHQRPARSGADIQLSVDDRLQQAAFSALAASLDESPAVGGAVIAQLVTTGEILALVSYPSFDIRRFSQGSLTSDEYLSLLQDPRQPLFNRAVQGEYPPGSTFKLVTAAAALSEGVVTESTVVDCRGSISIGSFTYRDWKLEGHGPQNIFQALANSCDVFFYTVGGGYGGQAGVGVARLADWARKFGLGSPTGINLPSESDGLVPDEEWRMRNFKEHWYIGNTYHLSIGQGDLLATPIQINNLTVAVANGGTLLQPTLLAGETRIRERGVAEEPVLATIREGIRRAVTEGTAFPLRTAAYTSAGKTGTAEIGGSDETHGWFTGFAPFEEPEVAITVLLERGGEGSYDAAPVVRKILDVYFGFSE